MKRNKLLKSLKKQKSLQWRWRFLRLEIVVFNLLTEDLPLPSRQLPLSEYIWLSKFSHPEQLHCHFYDVFLFEFYIFLEKTRKGFSLNCTFIFRANRQNLYIQLSDNTEKGNGTRVGPGGNEVVQSILVKVMWYVEKYEESEFFPFYLTFFLLNGGCTSCVCVEFSFCCYKPHFLVLTKRT